MSWRQTGRTTRQLQSAPSKSVFVWCNNQLLYPKGLLNFLERRDITLWPASALYTPKMLSCLRPPGGLVIDHATVHTYSVRAAIQYAKTRGFAVSWE